LFSFQIITNGLICRDWIWELARSIGLFAKAFSGIEKISVIALDGLVLKPLSLGITSEQGFKNTQAKFCPRTGCFTDSERYAVTTVFGILTGNERFSASATVSKCVEVVFTTLIEYSIN
jgi:hypothetical protein